MSSAEVVKLRVTVVSTDVAMTLVGAAGLPAYRVVCGGRSRLAGQAQTGGRLPKERGGGATCFNTSCQGHVPVTTKALAAV